MAARLLTPLVLLIALLLAGCGRDDPQAALDTAAQQLQDNLEAKATAAVLDQLHPQFGAQQQTLDRDWAKRSMVLLFLRYKNVQVLALSKDSQIDPTYPDKGHTLAQVALTGAEGLIPDSARHYQVKMEWWLEDDQWQLARLDWE